ncbi:MAG: hypothetical protein U0350_21060 [Caldilineaceae bacterium]
MQPPISDDFYREFLKTFQVLRDPVGLTGAALMQSPLVQQMVQRQPGLLPYQALQAVFKEILTLLAAENPDYADLLQGRYWEGKQVEEMLTAERPQPMSRRTFSNYQRNAITVFAYLFLQAESSLQNSPPVALALPVVENGVENPVEKRLEPIVAPGPTRPAGVTVSYPPHSPTRLKRWQLWGVLLLLPFLAVGLMSRGVWAGFLTHSSQPPADLLFEDNFEAGAGKWNADSNAWAIEADERGNHFYCVNTDGPYTNALAGSTTWRDYALQLDLKIFDSDSNGSGNILLRVSANVLPVYVVDFFAEKEGGVALARESPDYTTLDQALSGLPAHVWVPLRVEMRGGQMKLFVGSSMIPMLQTTDPNPILQGGIGLSAGFSHITHQARWKVCFDNIRVTRLQQ